jgi:hypothetical protein
MQEPVSLSIKQDGQMYGPFFNRQNGSNLEEVIATDMDAESCGPQ